MNDTDRKNALISTEIIGVGVLPEILVFPQVLDLGKVILNYGNADFGEITIKNSGRVCARFSV